MKYHPWSNRRHFGEKSLSDDSGMSDEQIAHSFRQWLQQLNCLWYLKDDYYAANGRRVRGAAGSVRNKKATSTPDDAPVDEDAKAAEDMDSHSETDKESADDENAENAVDPNTQLCVRLMRDGSMKEVSREDESCRKAKAFDINKMSLFSPV